MIHVCVCLFDFHVCSCVSCAAAGGLAAIYIYIYSDYEYHNLNEPTVACFETPDFGPVWTNDLRLCDFCDCNSVTVECRATKEGKNNNNNNKEKKEDLLSAEVENLFSLSPSPQEERERESLFDLVRK